MLMLIQCKKIAKGASVAQLLFEHVWKHFHLPHSASSKEVSTLNTMRFFGGVIDIHLKKSTTFHPQIDKHVEVVNRNIIHMLR